VGVACIPRFESDVESSQKNRRLFWSVNLELCLLREAYNAKVWTLAKGEIGPAWVKIALRVTQQVPDGRMVSNVMARKRYDDILSGYETGVMNNISKSGSQTEIADRDILVEEIIEAITAHRLRYLCYMYFPLVIVGCAAKVYCSSVCRTQQIQGMTRACGSESKRLREPRWPAKPGKTNRMTMHRLSLLRPALGKYFVLGSVAYLSLMNLL
jgi:hypothetical protein